MDVWLAASHFSNPFFMEWLARKLQRCHFPPINGRNPRINRMFIPLRQARREHRWDRQKTTKIRRFSRLFQSPNAIGRILRPFYGILPPNRYIYPWTAKHVEFGPLFERRQKWCLMRFLKSKKEAFGKQQSTILTLLTYARHAIH